MQQSLRRVKAQAGQRGGQRRSTTQTRASARAPVANAAAAAPAKVLKPVFPLVRIVGQDEVKLALILNIIDPLIGGVLIMGDRGTGKSTLVRGLSTLLPQIDVVANETEGVQTLCGYNSSPTEPGFMGPEARDRYFEGGKEPLPSASTKFPLVELPLGATEDRICGTIDIEAALTQGTKAFEPGLLAKANRGILYVDEVNLLEDNIVDVVLDSAAGGWNTVEREGVSITHPAKFILVGSGAPEEGELRPQLLDRFGLSANVSTIYNKEQRVALAKARITFDSEPFNFVEEAEAEEEELREKMRVATERLPSVVVPRELQLKIAELCAYLDIDGLRGDLVINRTARAFVAFEGEGRTEVTEDDVKRVCFLCLNHRMRKDPLDTMDSGTKVFQAVRRVFDSEAYRKEKEAEAAEKARLAEEAKSNPRAGSSAGSWGGLPGQR